MLPIIFSFKVNKYPWMVLVARFVSNVNPTLEGFCGGTLVASKYVITAAHCLESKESEVTPERIKVWHISNIFLQNKNIEIVQISIGDHNIASLDDGGLPQMISNVTSFIKHENFNQTNLDNDIALIELAEEVDLSTYTPACLAKTSDTATFDGKIATASGEIMMIW